MKIILVDDDPLIIESLKTIIEFKTSGDEDPITVMATGKSGQEAFDLYQTYRPDICLLDIRMGQVSGLDAGEQILKFNPQAKILYLTTFTDQEYIIRALNMGAHGYIVKQNVDFVVTALRAVNAGQFVFDAHIVDRFKGPSNSTSKSLEGLTDQENAIVRCVAEGMNNREIAQSLFLSEGTVRNYISRILEKLNLRDRTQLAIAYYKNT